MSKWTRLQNKADRLYQEVGRQVFGNKGCLICGRTYSCLHHFFPKSTSSALRYNFQNGIPLCVSCHCRIHSSDDPTLTIAIKEKMGEDWWLDLKSKRHLITKQSKKYYDEIIKILEEIKDK